MKKFLTISVSIAMLIVMVFCLVACNGGKGDFNTEELPAVEIEKAWDTTVTIPADFKAGLITLHDENSTYDKNFIDAFVSACKDMGVEYVISSGKAEDNTCYEAAKDLVEQGCDFIMADSFGHEDYIIKAAREFPEVQFCHATGYQAHIVNLPNFSNAFAAIYEGRYLAGVAAGLKLNEMIESGKITADKAKMGYVGAYTYAEVVSGYTSFYLGAKSVCPSVTMEVQFTGSWYDETAEKEAANKLITNGCVLISQHADSMGAPSACELAGVPNVSYNGSTVAACPTTFIVSSRINWAPYYKYVIAEVAAGRHPKTDWTGTIKSGSVELSAINNDAAAEGTVAKLTEVRAGIMNGTIKVFDVTKFTVDNGKVLGTDIVDENVVDGQYKESGIYSAPSFAYSVDGITKLNEKF